LIKDFIFEHNIWTTAFKTEGVIILLFLTWGKNCAI
jgi:hypothetical protein